MYRLGHTRTYHIISYHITSSIGSAVGRVQLYSFAGAAKPRIDCRIVAAPSAPSIAGVCCSPRRIEAARFWSPLNPPTNPVIAYPNPICSTGFHQMTEPPALPHPQASVPYDFPAAYAPSVRQGSGRHPRGKRRTRLTPDIVVLPPGVSIPRLLCPAYCTRGVVLVLIEG